MLFDRVFLYLNTATTIAAVMRTLGRNPSGKRARSPRKKLDFKPSLVTRNIRYQVIKTMACFGIILKRVKEFGDYGEHFFAIVYPNSVVIHK